MYSPAHVAVLLRRYDSLEIGENKMKTRKRGTDARKRRENRIAFEERGAKPVEPQA